MSSFVVPKIMNIVAIASSTRKIPNAACKVRWDGFAMGQFTLLPNLLMREKSCFGIQSQVSDAQPGNLTRSRTS